MYTKYTGLVSLWLPLGIPYGLEASLCSYLIVGSLHSYSPDFNPIENVWLLFKTNYRKAVWERRRIPRSEKELIELAQTVWEALLWARIYGFIDSMPRHVANCLKRGGGPTCW